MRQASLWGFVLLSILSIGCARSSSYYIKKGNDLFASGKFSDASINYKKAFQKDNSAEAYFRFGLSESRQQHFQVAWESLSRASGLAPQREDIRVEVGNLCLAALIANPSRPVNLYNCVEQISNQLLAKDRNSFIGLRFKGYIAFFDNRMDEAIECFRHAHQLKPDHIDVAVSLIDVLFRTNHEKEAEQVARSVIARNARNPLAYDALYRHYSSQGRSAEAEEVLKLEISNNPGEPAYVMQLCRFYWSNGRQDEASSLIAKMLSSTDHISQKHLMVGDFYGSVQRWDEARQQFEKGLLGPPAQKILFQKRLVDVLLAQGKKPEAVRLLDEILKQTPVDLQTIKIRAGLKLDSKDPQVLASVIADYKRLLQQNSADPELHYSLGQALAAKGDLAGARVQLQEAIQWRRNYIAPRNVLAQLALRQGKPDEALNWCNEALALNPQDAGSRLLKTIALRASGQYDQARREVEAILVASPKNGAALLQLGLVEIERKNFSAATAALTKLQQFNSADAAGGAAALYVAEGQPDKAFDLLKRTAAQSPNSVLLHDLLATLAVAMQKYDVAIEEFQTLLAKDPHSTTLYLRLAEAYRLEGDWSNSIATLERAQKATPDELTPTILLASSLERTGNLVGALGQYRRVAALRPEDPEVLNNLAYLTVETNGNLDEALQFAQRAIRKIPDQPNFADTIGWIYLKKSMPDSALQVFNSLVKKKPDDPTFRFHQGAALLQKGDKEQARIALVAALSQKPAKAEEDKIRGLLATISR
jgi:tetratricopeptide (TPR) repeat protein